MNNESCSKHQLELARYFLINVRSEITNAISNIDDKDELKAALNGALYFEAGTDLHIKKAIDCL